MNNKVIKPKILHQVFIDNQSYKFVFEMYKVYKIIALTPFKISIKIDHLLKEFILKDGFDV